MGTWIDFKGLRERLDFGEVLRSYGIQLKANGADQHRGHCPLPGHPKGSTSLCFSASFKKRIFRCHGCQKSGNILDFVILMAGLNPKVPTDVRKIAVQLSEQFPASQGNSQPPPQDASQRNQPPRIAAAHVQTLPQGREAVNAPLDFALKNLDQGHADLARRGLGKSTIDHFGLGYCSKGLFSGRIAIPLHNQQGKLIGYTGLITETFEGADDAPKYLWPEAREHNGVRHVFDRSKVLYNAHTIRDITTDLLVVQYPESAWWLWQCGYRNVVAVLGEGPSLEQSKAIIGRVRPAGRIWFLTDGNKVGEQCAQDLFFDVGPHRFCKWIKLPAGKPEHLPVQQLATLLKWDVRS